MPIGAFGNLKGFKMLGLPQGPLELEEVAADKPMGMQFIPITDEGDAPAFTLDDRDAALIMVMVAAALMRHLLRERGSLP